MLDVAPSSRDPAVAAEGHGCRPDAAGPTSTRSRTSARRLPNEKVGRSLSFHSCQRERDRNRARRGDLLPEFRAQPAGRSRRGSRKRGVGQEHEQPAQHHQSDHVEQQTERVARFRGNIVQRALVRGMQPGEQDDSRSRREAGALRGAHRRRPCPAFWPRSPS